MDNSPIRKPSKNGFKKNQKKRDGDTFVTIPHVVIDSPGYRNSGPSARSLLLDIARQYTGRNNGQLVACRKYLKPLGWNSDDTINKAKNELIACGLICEIRTGRRPNVAAWYALTWLDLDIDNGIDINPATYGKVYRGCYMRPEQTEKRTRTPPKKNESLTPSYGAGRAPTVPSNGVSPAFTTPSTGTIRLTSGPTPTPSNGAYLETPSPRGHAQGWSPFINQQRQCIH